MDGNVQVRRALERKRIMEAFGARMRELRNARGWSPREFSERSGLTTAEISQIECARREPRLTDLLLLADVFEMPLPDLLCGIPIPRGRRPSEAGNGRSTRLSVGRRQRGNEGEDVGAE